MITFKCIMWSHIECFFLSPFDKFLFLIEGVSNYLILFSFWHYFWLINLILWSNLELGIFFIDFFNKKHSGLFSAPQRNTLYFFIKLYATRNSQNLINRFCRWYL